MPDPKQTAAPKDGPRIDGTIPGLNEAAHITEAVARIVIEPWVARLVIVDGGSTDSSRALRQAMNARHTIASSDDTPTRRDVSRRRWLPRPPSWKTSSLPAAYAAEVTREATRRGAGLRPTFPSQACAVVCEDEHLSVALQPRRSAQHPGPTLRSYPVGS